MQANGLREYLKKLNFHRWVRDAAAKQHDIERVWGNGHAGHNGNERADALATEGMAPYKP